MKCPISKVDALKPLMDDCIKDQCAWWCDDGDNKGTCAINRIGKAFAPKKKDNLFHN